MNDVPLETKGSTVETDRTKSTTGLVYHTKRDSGEKNEGWFSRTLQSALEKTEDMFGSLGRLVVHRPLLVMFMSLIVCGLCGIGFLNFETESRPEELWVPQNTEAVKDYRYVQDVWQAEARFNVYYATAKDGPLQSRATLQKIYDLHQRVLAINVTADSDRNQFPGKWDYNRLCFRYGEFCGVGTILDLFDYDITLINSLTDAEIEARIADPQYYISESGRPITQNDIVGFDSSGNVAAFRGAYVVQSNELEKNNIRYDPVAEPWEREGTNIFLDDNSPVSTLPQFSSAWSEEFGKAIEGDAFNLTIAFIIIIIYLMICLGRRDPVDCMLGLSLCAVLSVGLAIAASYGLASGFGERYNPLHGVIPFLLIGLGVDDAFILVTTFQRAMRDECDNYADAVEITMRRGGMSILITSLTDFLAFAIGSSTNLPALSSFCVYAGLGVLFDFFFQITFFMACLVLNARRSEARRRDVAVCIKDKDEKFITNKSPARGYLCLSCQFFKNDIMEPIFNAFGKALVWLPSRIFVIVLFLVFIALSSAGVNQIETNFRADWFLPADSYLVDAIDTANKYFTQTTVFNVYIRDIDYFTRQDELWKVSDFFLNSTTVIDGSSDYWFPAFMGWAAVTTPYSSYYSYANRGALTNETLFYNGLYEFIHSSNGTRYEGDIQFYNEANPSQGVRATRGAAQIGATEFSGTGQERFDAMTDLRSDLGQAMSYDDARAFNQAFIFWERFGVIREELVKNLGIALAVMSTIVFLLIYNGPVVVAVIIAIGATVLNVFGMAYWWGVQINFVVTVFLLIAIGLSVDYSAHIGHAFKEAHGTASERVISALTGTGPPVFNAIFSTFLSILILWNAQTYIFQVFFQMFTLTTVFGGFNGLVVLPVILTFIGGDRPASDTPEGMAHDIAAGRKVSVGRAEKKDIFVA